MANNCNCNKCGQSQCNNECVCIQPSYADLGCIDTKSECVIYNGVNVPNLNIVLNQNLNQIIQNINNKFLSLEDLIGEGGGGSFLYTPQGPTFITVGGIDEGTDLGTTPTSIQDLLDDMFYPYIAPEVSLSSTPSQLIREKGNDVASVTLQATTVKHSSDITDVTFLRNGTPINVVADPNEDGAVEIYIDNVPVETNTTYTATVSDGDETVTSNTRTYSFISAYYYGVGPVGLTPTQISALTKSVIPNTATVVTNTSPTNQIYYFAYPDSYPALTSILDNNGFETIGDYTVTTGNSITNSYGEVDTYRIYRFINLTTQVNFNNTFKQ